MSFRHSQTERVCRRQIQSWWEWQKVLQMGRKHCGKRRNCSLRAISPFPTVFSKDLYWRHVKPGPVWERVKHLYFTSIEKQVLSTYTYLSRFCFLGPTPVLGPNMWVNKNPQVNTSSQESNLGHYGCETEVLPHYHGHHWNIVVKWS